MIKYDTMGVVEDVAYGEYEGKDIKIFRDDGYVDSDEASVMRAEQELLEKLIQREK
jgi:hypothetical protein